MLIAGDIREGNRRNYLRHDTTKQYRFFISDSSTKTDEITPVRVRFPLSPCGSADPLPTIHPFCVMPDRIRAIRQVAYLPYSMPPADAVKYVNDIYRDDH